MCGLWKEFGQVLVAAEEDNHFHQPEKHLSLVTNQWLVTNSGSFEFFDSMGSLLINGMMACELPTVSVTELNS